MTLTRSVCSVLISTLALAVVATDQSMAAGPASQSPDLILHNANVWTVDDAKPTAEAVAIKGGRIVKVGSDPDVLSLKGASTRVVDLNGKLMLPGFIDAHTHFENATQWFYEARIIDIETEDALLERLAETAKRVPEGMWITGYDWGASTAAAARRKGQLDYLAFVPSLSEVDRITPNHPVLLRRHDGSYFVNSKGMALARVNQNSLDPSNGAYGRDTKGELTGMLFGSAGERMVLTLPPPSRARTLIAAEALMKELNRNGITGIHDIARVDAISQEQLYHTNVERSNSDVSIFNDLRESGKLTVRVNPIVTMDNWKHYASHGISPGAGDDLIRYGALKAFVDGFYMEKPYLDNPSNSGGLTFRVVDEATSRSDVIEADKLGFDPAVHVIGDKAHRLLLDWYEAAIAANPPRDRRLRIIHAWFPALREIERAGKIGAIAEITPYHLMREKAVIDKKLGPQRAETAFAWRTMMDHGIRMNIVSDWPGSFDRGSIAPLNPLENLYYALARADLAGEPPGGWRPEQGFTIQEAIRAYTINPAYTSHEDGVKGSITEGKFADLIVLSDNILKMPAEKLPQARVLYTIFNGNVVYASDNDSTGSPVH